MKITAIVTGAMLLTSLSSFATEEKAENPKKDFERYCYLDDKAYSAGARIEQHGRVVQCRRNSEGLLSWQEPEK
jgi:hypothetical protein